MTFRQLHRKIAPILFLPLGLSALTGLGYRLGRSWFQIPGELADTLLSIHEGAYLGRPLIPIYLLLVGLGLLGLLITGLTMLFQAKPRPVNSKRGLTGRQIHRFIAPLACLPLFATATTGIAYRLGKSWLDLPRDQTKVLLSIHQGTYLGLALRPYYVLLVGLGLLVLLMTGIKMTGILRKRPRPSKSTHQ